MSSFKYESIKDILSSVADINILEDEEVYFHSGRVLKSGFFTAVIKIDYPFLPSAIKDKFIDPVLLLTTEIEKKELVKSILKLDTIALNFQEERKSIEQDWLFDNDFSSIEEAEEEGEEFNMYEYVNEFNIMPWLETLNDYGNIEHFFMEKLESDNIIDSELLEFTNDMIDILFPFKEAKASLFNEISFEKNEIMNTVKYIWKKNTSFSREYINKAVELFYIIVRDMRRAASVLSGFIELDIHENQFVKVNGQIFCSDPFAINV